MTREEPTDVTIDQDEEYKSSEDEDFNPDTVAVPQEEDDELSSSEDDAPQAKKPLKKRKKAQLDAEELDSGDEVTIKESRKSKKRKADEDEESGGEGGLVKTRAQRAAEKQERQEFQKANVDNITVDVDALWASMTSKPVGRIPPEPPKATISTSRQDATATNTANDHETTALDGDDDDDDGMITIRRTYDFAGQTVTEEKRVPKTSAEAKLYLTTTSNPSKPSASHPQHPKPTPHPSLRRPLRRSSKYEPNPTGEVKGLPLDRQRLRTPSRSDVLAQQKRLEEEAKKGKAVKLNTVQKSAIDWAAHVDKEGYQEELDEYGRSKQGYLGKMDFLKGVHGRKEDEDRRVRMAKS